MGIKSCLFKSIRQIKHKYDLEIVQAEITTLSDTKVLFCSCYRPPDSENIWMTQFENFLEDACSRHLKVVLAGDFNLPRACWKNTHGNSLGGSSNVGGFRAPFLGVRRAAQGCAGVRRVAQGGVRWSEAAHTCSDWLNSVTNTA